MSWTGRRCWRSSGPCPRSWRRRCSPTCPPEDQQALIQGAATDQELSAIVEELCVDDAVDLLEELPAGVVKRVLQAARPDTRQAHQPVPPLPGELGGQHHDRRVHRPEAGSMTVAQAIAHIRRTGADSESIYTCYVTDAARRLEGVVTVRELLHRRGPGRRWPT